MDYIITTTADYIIIQAGMRRTSLLKTKITGIETVSGTNAKLIILIDSGSSPFTMGYYVGHMTVNGVAQTTLAMAEASIKGQVQIGAFDVVTATAGQTTVVTTFTANTLTRVYVAGSLVVPPVYTIIAGQVVFAAGVLSGGEQLFIENLS
jgi:hypothetical protein